MIRRLAWFSFAFAAGIALAQYLLPPAVQPLFAAGFALAALTGLLAKDKKTRLRILLAGFGLAFAMVWNMGYTALAQAPAVTHAGEIHKKGEATVLRYAEERVDDGWGQEIKYRIRVRLETETGSHPAYLYAGEELLALEPGNTIRGTFTVTDAAYIDDEPITSFTSKGVWLLLFPAGELTAEEGTAGSIRWHAEGMGRRTADAVASLYEGETAALVLAVLTGEKEGFSDEMYTVLSEAGILHVASVSGLHCMFLLAMIRMLLQKRRWLTAMIGLPVLAFYALMVGAVPSVVRSVIMVMFLLLAPLLRRENDRITALAAALMLILMANPFAVASISLQLSFGAVAGMIWLTPKLYPFLTGGILKGNLWRFIAASLSATLGALVFTVPLSAWYFNNLVLISPVTNILCLTAVNAVFVLALVSLALAAVCPPAAAMAALPVKWLTAYLLLVSREAAALPYHAVYFDSPYIALWLGFAYLLLGICAVRKGRLRRNLLALSSAALALVLALGLTRLDYRYGEMNVLALDVGQGQSIIVTAGEDTVLIDCGTNNSFLSAGDIAGDLLLTMGADRLDYLVLTHYHTDHTDGLPVLLTRVKVEKLLVPPAKSGDIIAEAVLALTERYGVEVEFVAEDREVPLGSGALRLFAPVEGLDEENENENGLAVLCSAGDFDFLVTGDMSGETEHQLLQQKHLPDIELMMVGHHGSGRSSSEEFLAAVKPETGIISVGDNSYGHPAESALKRLAKYGVDLYRTDREGHIRVTVR